MGFNTSATTLTVTAKLTPIGRKLLVSTNNSLITSFSLGDSDAFYDVSAPLATGEVPSSGGMVGPNATTSNSTTSNINFKSVLILNGNGVLKKSVEPQSVNILTEQKLNGQQVNISGTQLTQNVIDRSEFATSSLVNLLYSFGLPSTLTEDSNYTGLTYAQGGFSDTAFSGLAQSKFVVFGIDSSVYGETIDGKSIKLVLPTTAGTYTIYSTFQNKGGSLQSEDANYNDVSTLTNEFGYNIAFLFSDDIKTPNGGSGSLSWATGYNTVKPFSLNQKQLYNFQTNSNIGLSADTIVGIAYLDKGFLVITDPTIVANYGVVDATGATTGVTVSLDSVSTNVYQTITCIAARGEFGSSTNPTYDGTGSLRISEVGLYDASGNLVAFGKTDRQISKNINEFLALGIKIIL